MKFIELAEKRCSIRNFRQDPIPEAVLKEILTAGQLAPSAKNLQPYQFIVVTAEAGLDALAAAYPAPFFREAPVAVVICSEEEKGWVRSRYDHKNYTDVDCAIAMDHMSLAATDLGLGSCWIGAFNPDLVKTAMGIPEGVEPLNMLLLGYPNAEGLDKKRKPLDELVRYDHW